MPKLSVRGAKCWKTMLQCRIVVFAPHPDDEVIGAFSILSHRSIDRFLIFVTDGAPLKLGSKRAKLRLQRFAESNRLTEFFGLPESHLFRFDIPDQEAGFRLSLLIDCTRKVLREIAPAMVIVPAYEGGHPDHDSTAFAVHRAVREFGANAPQLIEMCLYHSRNGAMETGEFLPNGTSTDTLTVTLTQKEDRLKRQAYEVYHSQKEVLKYFSTSFERFRAVPNYDFLAAPHPGKLFYENFDWNMSGCQWRQLAKQAMADDAFVRE